MALADSKEAIGAVTNLLLTRLQSATGVTVEVGRPEVAAKNSGRKFNLFLYRLSFDGYMRNIALDDGQPAPLWLVLHYLITAIDDKDSDSVKAHRLLGQGLGALQAISPILPPVSELALARNPEPLKVTFEEADVELLSKIMQGSDEKFRLSAAFQVRPVLIAPEVVAEYAPLVTSVGPPAAPGVLVLPNLGARVSGLEPVAVESGQQVSVLGTDVEASEWVMFGPLPLGVSAAPSGQVRVMLPLAPGISAGPHPVAVARQLPNGRLRSSNAVLGMLLPTVDAVTVAKPLGNAAGKLFGSFSISGRLLGGPEDDVFVAFYRDGEVKLSLDVAGSAAQTSLTVSVSNKNALPPGEYRLVLRVNGAQAPQSPVIDWT